MSKGSSNPKYGKGSKSRISNTKLFGHNYDEINWPSKPENKRLQNYKKCIGCGACYDLDVTISKCEECGSIKFIPMTDYKNE